jgi:uncharacterized protein (TIGR02145 family)
MKNIFRTSGVLLIIISIFLIQSCKKEEVPVLTTSAITDITGTTASGGGTIISEGSGNIIARGLCWSTAINPTLAASKTIESAGSGTYTRNMAGLNEGNIYYVRSYATNSVGTGYGNQISFVTSQVVPARLTTASISSITLSSAISGGDITEDGGGNITERGICWNTGKAPTISDFKTADGSPGTGGFISNITGLSAGKSYYVRAYATNSAGTAYGNQILFTTSITDIENNMYHTITIGSMVWTAENLKVTKFKDGTSIPLVADNYIWSALTTPAYCWYNNEISNKSNYGALYNWYTIETGKLCPQGWHVSSHAEIGNLESYLDVNLAGGELKDSILWNSPNTGGNNRTGFSAHPGGYRFNDDGSFYNIGYFGYWWTSFETIYYFMGYNSSQLGLNNADNKAGLSVRCLRD